MAEALIDERQRWRNMAVCIASLMTVTLTLGVTLPLLAVILKQQGTANWLIGASSAAQVLAIVVMVPIAPRLMVRLGTLRLMRWGVVAIVLCLALLPLFPNVWLWFPIRFALGLATELVFTAGDIWINQIADDRRRGRIVATYSMFLHGGFAVGPVLIWWLGTEDWTVLWIGMAIVAMALVPLSFGRAVATPIEGRPQGAFLHYVRLVPVLMVAGLMFGLTENAMMALLTPYGIDRGLTGEAAALLLTGITVGGVIGQPAIGWLADRFDRRALLAAMTLLALVMLLVLPRVIDDPMLVWPAMALLGIAMGSFYTLGMVLMGERFRGIELVAVNAAFVCIWGLGSVAGPVVAGDAMDRFGPDGLPAFGAICCAAYLALILWRIARTRGGERSM